MLIQRNFISVAGIRPESEAAGRCRYN